MADWVEVPESNDSEGGVSGVGWRPISSAPKDGSAILVFAPNGVPTYGYDGAEGWPKTVLLARWYAPNHLEGDNWITPHTESATFEGSEYTGSWTEVENLRCEPTHWMPLPDPPNPSQSQ